MTKTIEEIEKSFDEECPVARGWCTEENKMKVMDPDLALAICKEVKAFYRKEIKAIIIDLTKEQEALLQKEREEAIRDACTHEYEKVGGNWDSYAVFICKKCGSEKVVDL